MRFGKPLYPDKVPPNCSKVRLYSFAKLRKHNRRAAIEQWSA
jgi:hypothetical protein